MRALEVPRRLYEEFAEKYCLGEERRLCSAYDQWFLCRILNPEDPDTGFAGAIGIREFRPSGRDENPITSANFALWGRVPTDESTVFSPDPVLLIKAGFGSAGIWAAGRGERVHEYLSLQMNCPQGEHPCVALCLKILARSNELAADSTRERYWQAEKRPKEDYTEDPRFPG